MSTPHWQHGPHAELTQGWEGPGYATAINMGGGASKRVEGLLHGNHT